MSPRCEARRGVAGRPSAGGLGRVAAAALFAAIRTARIERCTAKLLCRVPPAAVFATSSARGGVVGTATTGGGLMPPPSCAFCLNPYIGSPDDTGEV